MTGSQGWGLCVHPSKSRGGGRRGAGGLRVRSGKGRRRGEKEVLCASRGVGLSPRVVWEAASSWGLGGAGFTPTLEPDAHSLWEEGRGRGPVCSTEVWEVAPQVMLRSRPHPGPAGSRGSVSPLGPQGGPMPSGRCPCSSRPFAGRAREPWVSSLLTMPPCLATGNETPVSPFIPRPLCRKDERSSWQHRASADKEEETGGGETGAEDDE